MATRLQSFRGAKGATNVFPSLFTFCDLLPRITLNSSSSGQKGARSSRSWARHPSGGIRQHLADLKPTSMDFAEAKVKRWFRWDLSALALKTKDDSAIGDRIKKHTYCVSPQLILQFLYKGTLSVCFLGPWLSAVASS